MAGFQALVWFGPNVHGEHATVTLLVAFGASLLVVGTSRVPPYLGMCAAGASVVAIIVAPESNRWALVVVRPLLRADECAEIIAKAEEQAAANALRDPLANESREGWYTARHTNYATTDQAVKDIPSLGHLERTLAEGRVFPLLAEHYGVPAGSLRVADMFIVKYDEAGQRRLAEHRDKGLLTFNVALSPAPDYEGGGTRFSYFRRTVSVSQGQVMLHPSRMLHEGVAVSRGRRYIIVGHVHASSAPRGSPFFLWGFASSCLRLVESGAAVESFCRIGSGMLAELVYDWEGTACFTVATILVWASLAAPKAS